MATKKRKIGGSKNKKKLTANGKSGKYSLENINKEAEQSRTSSDHLSSSPISEEMLQKMMMISNQIGTEQEASDDASSHQPSPPAEKPYPHPPTVVYVQQSQPRTEPKDDDFDEDDPLKGFFIREQTTEGADFIHLAEEIYSDLGKDQEVFDEGLQEFLGFMLDNEEYAISIMHIKEIIKYQPITEVPRAPQYVPGVLSLRGQIIPIIDLRKRLKLKAKDPDHNTRILVLLREDQDYGLIVDRVSQVVRFSEDEIEPPPQVISSMEADFIEGVGKFKDNMLIILNLESVLEISLY